MDLLRFSFVLFALFVFHALAGKIYFPLEDAQPPSFNITALELIRGTRTYEDTVDRIISRGVLKLTLSITKFMSQNAAADNIVYAPVNIAGALALVLLGSHGKTFQELTHVLGLATGVDIQMKSQKVHEQFGRLFSKLEQSASTGQEVRLATAIFVQDDYPIRSVFKQASENFYRSEVLHVDFKSHAQQAKLKINAWVNDRTGGKIKTMLEENAPASTKAIIASALYFKAAWEKPFFGGSTKRRPFYSNGREDTANGVTMVDMMSNGGLFPYFRDRTLDCEIMGFPYKENRTTLYVIVPNNSNRAKLAELQNKLTAADLERLVDSTRYTRSVIGFPKMTLQSSLDLSSALMDFGVKSLFNPQEANLALMSPGRQQDLYANDAFSEPFVNNVPLAGNVPFVSNVVRNPISANINGDFESVLIFSRFGEPLNCTQIFDPASNISKCQEIDEATKREVVYKKFGDKVGRRINRSPQQPENNNIDAARLSIKDSENPGLYADKVLHKVFIEITESGTEASAATSVSLTRGGDITTFRVDVPFLFFIRNQETRMVLFWGSVNSPTPNFS